MMLEMTAWKSRVYPSFLVHMLLQTSHAMPDVKMGHAAAVSAYTACQHSYERLIIEASWIVNSLTGTVCTTLSAGCNTLTAPLSALYLLTQQMLPILRCMWDMAGGTELKILFGEAWLLGVTRQRLAGEVPFAREGNTLCCFGETLPSACC